MKTSVDPEFDLAVDEILRRSSDEALVGSFVLAVMMALLLLGSMFLFSV